MLHALILGLVQGLTEFLPVSSSGHLVIAQQLFGFTDIDPAFNVFVQGGTVISLLVYFAPKLKDLHLNATYLKLLMIGCLPAIIIGLYLEDTIDVMFSSASGLALGFLLTSLVLWMTRRPQKVRELNHRSALGIGLAQAASLLPSLSRSGATIGMAIIVGVREKEAFNFSFLMSIPLIAGASILSARHITWEVAMTPAYLAGFAVAAISGYFSLRLLETIMLRGQLYRFAPYTLGLAVLCLLFIK